MSRDLFFGKGKELKNKIFKTKGFNVTTVPRSTQPQLKQISQDPKKYEDEKCEVPIVTSVNDFNQVSNTRHHEDKSVGTLVKNFELIKLSGDIKLAAFQPKEIQKTLSPANQKNNSVSPEYVEIAGSLREKIEKFPDICSIPFFVNSIQNASSPSIKITFTDNVPLPYEIQGFHGNDLWKTITSQLIKIKELCHQNNSKLNFPKLFQSSLQIYRPDCQQWSNFRMLDRPDLEQMLKITLPFIVDQAVSLPNLLESSIPILLSGESKTVYLTRKLCSSLLANALFCTIPEPKIGQLPDFNFFRLFNDTQSQRCEVKKEKIKCLLQYFQTMKKYESNKTFQSQIVSFERRHVKNKIHWEFENEVLCEVKVEPYKKIEEAVNMLQVDFANKVVGGGVLNDGSVMEEIRFCISPELLVSRLFTQTLNDNEVLVVTGTEIFSRYSGYSTSFKWEGPSNIDLGQNSLDNFGRTFTQVVAMDACSFKRNESEVQFQQKLIDRELHKAYVAFIHGKAGVSPVATGNWGCGAFNGNQELKFIIQWMAASHQGRPCIIYHTIGDMKQTQYIEELSGFLIRKNVTVGELYKSVLQFSKSIGNRNVEVGALFRYVKKYFNK